jgi:hypothetical protein
VNNILQFSCRPGLGQKFFFQLQFGNTGSHVPCSGEFYVEKPRIFTTNISVTNDKSNCGLSPKPEPK